jgi:hypothetical protein
MAGLQSHTTCIDVAAALRRQIELFAPMAYAPADSILVRSVVRSRIDEIDASIQYGVQDTLCLRISLSVIGQPALGSPKSQLRYFQSRLA